MIFQRKTSFLKCFIYFIYNFTLLIYYICQTSKKMYVLLYQFANL